MAIRLAFAIAFCVLVCNKVSIVRTTDTCKTHADCGRGNFLKFCCGGQFGSKQRSCTYASCLYDYCSIDSDCGDSSLCCRSNECVKDGCSGCISNANCSLSHVCCKKTYSLDQTVCGSDCINETCNSNDDCGGRSECCRSGKCVGTGCYDKCASNSECDLGQYCCKKKSGWGDSCSDGCVDEICSSDDDCGGPQECCISNKCVTSGCSGCTANSNCSSGHYCCKKRLWYELNECSADCIGKSCGTNDDCGGPSEICDSNDRCVKESSTGSSSLPPWLIAVIVASIVVLLIIVGVFVAVFWYIKRLRPANATRAANRGTVPLLNTQHQGPAAIQDPQPNTQFPTVNSPSQCPRTGFQNQRTDNITRQSFNPTAYNAQAQGFRNRVQGTPYQGLANQNPPNNTPHRGYENAGFRNPSQDYHHQTPLFSNLNQHVNVDPLQNPPNDPPIFHSPPPSDTAQVARETQFQDKSEQGMYPQNYPNQGQGNNDFQYPPHNPLYTGNL